MGILEKNKKIDDKLTKLRNKKCEPVAREIMQIFARFDIDPKDTKDEETFKTFAPLSTEINKLMKEKDLTISEVNFVWSIVQAIIDNAKQLSVAAVQGAFELAEQKLFKVELMRDVTLQNIDNVLQYN